MDRYGVHSRWRSQQTPPNSQIQKRIISRGFSLESFDTNSLGYFRSPPKWSHSQGHKTSQHFHQFNRPNGQGWGP